MCLQVIIELFANAIGIFILAFFGFIAIFYGLGLLISIGIGVIVLIALYPLLWIFIMALIVGAFFILAK
ncbi:MAG: hypothetical protein Q4P17_02270 [Methanobacterium sp.]|nr:hypothetical protein [Methanobacterium sp.]